MNRANLYDSAAVYIKPKRIRTLKYPTAHSAFCQETFQRILLIIILLLYSHAEIISSVGTNVKIVIQIEELLPKFIAIQRQIQKRNAAKVYSKPLTKFIAVVYLYG